MILVELISNSVFKYVFLNFQIDFKYCIICILNNAHSHNVSRYNVANEVSKCFI